MQTVRISIHPLGKVLDLARGSTLIDVLHEFGVEFPCGATGSCGKCRIKVLSGNIPVHQKHRKMLDELELGPEWRLACMSTAEEDLVLEVAQFEVMIQADDSHFTFKSRPGLGVAVDLGTSTLVAQLLDLNTGKVMAVETSLNPQRRWGSDLISRLEAALAGDGDLLTKAIRRKIGQMLLKLTGGKKIRLEKLVIVGNTVMQHFFSGSDCRPLSFYPFESNDLGARYFTAGELDWNISCDEIIFCPSIGSFVGSDILAGIHATGMARKRENSVLVDLGTNGEIVIGNRERILCASTAAGPAFEGAKISSGMLAGRGAISSVSVEGHEIKYRVIGNVKAAGICGSGLIDAVAVFLQLGLLGEFGEILSGAEAISLSRDVKLRAKDIQEFLLAKAAIASGLSILLRKFGITGEEVKDIYISGAFGTYINLEKMLETGMMDFPLEGFHKRGNSALIGAKMFLFSDMVELEKILEKCSHVNLESEPDFQDIFVENLTFRRSTN